MNLIKTEKATVKLFVVVLILFFASFLLNTTINAPFLKFPSALLLFYFPGRFINDIFLKKDKKILGWYGALSVDILSSIFSIYIVYMLFNPYIGFTPEWITLLVVSFNIALFVVWNLIYTEEPAFTDHKMNKVPLFFLLIILFYFLSKIIISPYIAGQDTSLYISAYKSILETGKDYSLLAQTRNAFSYLIVFSHYIAGFNWYFIFKLLVPLLFATSTLIIFTISKSLRNNLTQYIALLSLISIPAISMSIERVRPESLMYVVIIPIIILSTLGVFKKKLKYAVLALSYSLLSTQIHESAYIITLSVLPVFITTCCIWLSRKKDKIINLFKKFGLRLIAIIVIPYILLAPDIIKYLKLTFGNPYIGQFLNTLKNTISSFHWNWWFLDHYTTIDGGAISMPGAMGAIYYYGYNGGTIVIILLIASLVYKYNTNKKRSEELKKIAIPSIIVIITFLAISELLPRLNVPLLPDRAWPYISVASFVILFALISDIKRLTTTQISFFKALLILNLAITLAASYISTLYIGNFATKNDITLAQELKKIEADALIISTQPSDNLTELYADKKFIFVNLDGKTDTDTSDQLLDALSKSATELINEIENSTPVYRSLEVEYLFKGRKIKESYKEEKINDPIEKRYVMERYDPYYLYRYEKRLRDLNQINKHPVYVIYSFYRFTGPASLSPEWMNNNDYKNYDFFKSIPQDQAFIKNEDFIVLKIN